MMRFRLSAIALLVVASACSDATTPQGPYGTFEVSPASSGPYPAPAPTVQVAQNGTTITGWIDTPTPCYTVTGNATMAHDTLVAHVVARQDTKNGVGCATVIQPWQYVLTAFDVPSTVVAVRVVHDSGDGTNVTVLEQAVTHP